MTRADIIDMTRTYYVAILLMKKIRAYVGYFTFEVKNKVSRTAVWNGFLKWFSKKYPDVVPSELSGKRMKAIEKEYLEEVDVEVNEYGEIVSKRKNNKGVRLKPHTFYGVNF